MEKNIHTLTFEYLFNREIARKNNKFIELYLNNLCLKNGYKYYNDIISEDGYLIIDNKKNYKLSVYDKFENRYLITIFIITSLDDKVIELKYVLC